MRSSINNEYKGLSILPVSSINSYYSKRGSQEKRETAKVLGGDNAG